MTTIALIPARGGSKGISRKNVRLLGGKPLIVWTIEAARAAQTVEHVFVTTEDAEIKAIALVHGAEVLDRPACLATDWVQNDAVAEYSVNHLKHAGLAVTTLVLLQPTSPFRTPQHIDEAVGLYRTLGGRQTVIAVYPDPRFHWKKTATVSTVTTGAHLSDHYLVQPVHHDPQKRLGRQWLLQADRLYAEAGSIYVVDAERLLHERCVRLPPFALYEMAEADCIDIDGSEDWERAEQRMRHLQGGD